MADGCQSQHKCNIHTRDDGYSSVERINNGDEWCEER